MGSARLIIGATLLAGVVTAAPLPAVASSAHAINRWTNCTHFNKIYPHGVGRIHAHDHTSGKPVTNFKHSNHLYAVAMRHNSDLDRDKDHIACEKA